VVVVTSYLFFVLVAQQMCEQASLVIADHELYITKASCSAARRGNSAESGDIDSEADDSEHSRTIFVEDVPSNLVEFLELHLESEKKGGGDIEKLIYRNGGILVTFEEVQGLMSCRICNKILVVSLL